MSALSAFAVDAPAASPGPEVGAAANCYHCGAPNPQPARWMAVVAGAERAFCCAGCQAVAQTLHAAGLDNLYAGRTSVAARPESEADDDWARWGAAAESGGLVRALPDGRREASLLLEGMTCGACVPLVESWVGRQPGVAAACVNYATRRALVTWDPRQTQLAAVLRAIAAVGYRAFPYDPARREALARRERRALLTRMAVALLAMMQVMMFAIPVYLADDGVAPEHRKLLEWASFVLTLPALFYSAAPFFTGAWRDVTHRRLGMDVPVVLGLSAAFAASAWSTFAGAGPVYYDSVTMFVALLLVARYVELAARQKAGDAIESIARQRPDTAERLARWPGGGDGETVPAATLSPGDVVLVRPGALVPADGAVLDGRSHVEEAMLTGESAPRPRAPGDALWAGAVNRDNALVMRVDAAGEDTRLAAILRLAERAAATRPAVVKSADRIAAVFVAALLALAAATAAFWWLHEPSRAFAVTFAVLAVSCPCALALATPAALAAAAGALARRGVVLARSDALEALAGVTHMVLDKTGTLTEGRIRLAGCATADGRARVDVIALAAAVEARSEHPLARALVAAAAGGPRVDAEDIRQASGEGVSARVAGIEVRVGRPAFVAALAGAMPAALADFARGRPDTLVGLNNTHGWHAVFAFADTLRPGARALVAQLHALRVTPLVLSGDRPESVAAVATALGIADARGALLPEDKRAAIAALQARGARVAMAGDGINDAPALAQSQVSLALGSGAPLAQWTADLVLLSDRIELVAEALVAARRTFAVIRENLAWAIVYNGLAIPAAAFGFVTPLLAAAGMSGSSLAVVANALRLTRAPKTASAPAGAKAAPESAWKS
ncbi:MAG: heavy metal translocating P-type ATPase [Betaproteobacteria bacterium]|nr:heavy metal translocating P-type ATPase [Betaproteobacteria bacterium]